MSLNLHQQTSSRQQIQWSFCTFLKFILKLYTCWNVKTVGFERGIFKTSHGRYPWMTSSIWTPGVATVSYIGPSERRAESLSLEENFRTGERKGEWVVHGGEGRFSTIHGCTVDGAKSPWKHNVKDEGMREANKKGEKEPKSPRF